MILTGPAIASGVADGSITIDPFDPGQVNPNSYNYRLGNIIHRVQPDKNGNVADAVISKVDLVEGRVLLKRNNLYLATTFERIGSKSFVTSLIGRSSLGRLGLFLQVAANIGHQGTAHKWTLEMMPVLDIYVYPGQIIGQVSFWACEGSPFAYGGWYAHHDVPMPSRLPPRVEK
jgi:dCTP deaminase